MIRQEMHRYIRSLMPIGNIEASSLVQGFTTDYNRFYPGGDHRPNIAPINWSEKKPLGVSESLCLLSTIRADDRLYAGTAFVLPAYQPEDQRNRPNAQRGACHRQGSCGIPEKGQGKNQS
jgi:hypothetical protein